MVMDYLLTLIVPVALAICVLYGNKNLGNQDAFMNKEFTRALRGACCIIVILVHIPLAYANKLQDGIGSFAYVCVTLFFIMSAYGMNISASRSPAYLRHFWRNRLSALLIPQLLVNLSVVVGFMLINVINGGGRPSFLTLVHINGYVLVLLQYCLWFYLVTLGRYFYGERTAQLMLIIGVAVSSLVMYFCFDANDWCYERWGLVWGVLLFLYMPKVKRLVKPNVQKIVAFGLLGFMLGAAYLKFKPVFFYGEYLLKIVLGMTIILLLFTLSSQRKFGNKAINFLGDISYEVYLSHHVVMTVLSSLFPLLPSGCFILITVLGTIMLSAILHHVGSFLVKRCRI